MRSTARPSQLSTDIWHHAEADLDAAIDAMRPGTEELYRPHLAGFRRMIPLSQKLAVPADDVAKAIEKAVTARRPRAR